MEKSLESKLLQILEIKKLENRAPAKENEPFAEKYEARKKYKQILEDIAQAKEEGDDPKFLKAVLLASIARTHFDTDENHDAGVRCKKSLEMFSKIEDPLLLFRGINWVGLMLNYLGFHAVFGERFYEGILLLDSAEKIYWAVKAAVKKDPSGDWNDLASRKLERKLYLDSVHIREESKALVGEYVKGELLAKLLSHARTVREWSTNPELSKNSSELISEVRHLTSKFEHPALESEKFVSIGSDPTDFMMELCEDNFVQSVFFQAQVYGKLMEKDLSAEYCGITLQRQYFKFLKMKEAQSKEATNEDSKPQIVADFDYKDFTNNSMGLSMYYSEKLMYGQSCRLLELANEVLGSPHAQESEEVTLLRASLVHMKANILRDFFMFTCMILKESGSARQESRQK